MTRPGRAPRLAGRIVLGTVLVSAAPRADGQTAPPGVVPETAKDIGTVNATGTGGGRGDPTPLPGTAAFDAPSRAPLDAAQPTSLVGPRFIERSVVNTQNYDSIIKFTPSVQNIEPAGPGLQQNFNETIRGFNYRQFNTTFDGLVVPGTLSTFAPQTGAYFLAHDIGSVSVDRGPGTASTIGYATFGGTVSINSKPPSNTFSVNPYLTAGSYAVVLRGVEIDTGLRPELNGARGYLDLQALDSNGYLTGTSTRRRNAFTRFDAPVGENTVVTVVAMTNTSYTHTPSGATLAQIRTFGPNYALNDDLTSQAFRGYNTDHYSTDFEYVRVRSEIGDGWVVEDTPYTATYYHNGIVGLDPNGTTPNLTGRYFIDGSAASTALSNAVPGRAVHTDFRDIGNVLRVTKDTRWGQARAGFWFDRNAGDNYRTDVVLSQNNASYTKNATGSAYNYLYKNALTTYQPYIEFAATPLPGLIVTPGLRYVSTTRDLHATINQSTKLPARFSQTYDDVLPSIDARYTIQPGLAAYAQVAKGFLAPPLGVLQTTAPQQLNPQETTNYQTGATWQRDAFTLSGDLYYIDFSNRISSRTVAGTTIYYNGGGAVYRGIELEGTVRVGEGVSVYANAALNDTFYKHTSIKLAAAPEHIATVGPVLDRGNLTASFLAKYVGRQFGQDTPVNAFLIKSYVTADFAAGYTLPVLNGRKLDFRVNVNNMFNDHSVIGLNQLAGDGATGVFWTNPGRSVFFTVSATL